MKRREVFKLGLIGGALVSLARFGLAAMPVGPLAAPDRPRLAAIARALLGSAMPPEAAPRVVETIDGMLRGLPIATQAEVRELLDLLGLAPARLALAGFWRDWHEVPAAEVDAALDGWRSSRFALLRSAYGGLHELVMAGWYGDPASWSRIGYGGPPEIARPREGVR